MSIINEAMSLEVGAFAEGARALAGGGNSRCHIGRTVGGADWGSQPLKYGAKLEGVCQAKKLGHLGA